MTLSALSGIWPMLSVSLMELEDGSRGLISAGFGLSGIGSAFFGISGKYSISASNIANIISIFNVCTCRMYGRNDCYMLIMLIVLTKTTLTIIKKLSGC